MVEARSVDVKITTPTHKYMNAAAEIGRNPLTGPLFPIGIEHLIYMIFSVTVRHMVIKGI